MQTFTVAFLFDASVDDSYGAIFDPAFLQALAAIDDQGRTHSIVMRGDPIVAELAAKITAVSGSAKGGSYRQSYDMELYRTVIWDLADAISLQWNTVDPIDFPIILGRKAVHCIAVAALPVEFREEIDRLLRGTDGYLGAVEIDPGNPIQRRVFVDCLIKDAVITDGQVVMELGWEGHADSIFYGSDAFSPRGERRVPYGQLAELHQPISPLTELSPRGTLSMERYNGKRQFGLQERVLAALAYRDRTGPGRQAFAISVTDDPGNPLEASMPEAKFVRYLLDRDHKDGGPKARFFAEVLAIGQEDWRHLAAQFHEGLKKAEFGEVSVKSYDNLFDVRFTVTLPIAGLNGRTAHVETVWKMEPGKQPSFVTAFPGRANGAESETAISSTVVASNLKGGERWAAIFEIAEAAGKAAAIAAVPTPMRAQIVGGGIDQTFPIEMEGLVGHAWVRVKDGRRGFAKWALSNAGAYRHYQSGAQIFADADGQSIDRAKAYAVAFASVLRHNGIDCEFESRLD